MSRQGYCYQKVSDYVNLIVRPYVSATLYRYISVRQRMTHKGLARRSLHVEKQITPIQQSFSQKQRKSPEIFRFQDFSLSVLHQTVSEDSLMNQTVSGNPLSAQRHCLFHPVYSGKVILYLYIDLSSAEASKNQIVLPIVIHESALHLDIKRFIFHA